MAKPDPSKLEDDLKTARRDIKLKDERIEELRREVDDTRELLREMEEHVSDRDAYLEGWISAFGMVLNDKDEWTWDNFVQAYRKNIDDYEDLRADYNKLVGRFNRNIARVQPVGRPLAASEAQESVVLKRHKAGKSLRDIADETSLGLRTVRTIIGRANGSDRTTAQRRLRLDPEAKPASLLAQKRSIDSLPKRATTLLNDGKELLKAAKGRK